MLRIKLGTAYIILVAVIGHIMVSTIKTTITSKVVYLTFALAAIEAAAMQKKVMP